MNRISGLIVAASLAASLPCTALPPSLDSVAEKSPLSSFVIQPARIVWTSGEGVENAGNLLKPKSGQAVLKEPETPLVLKPGAGILIDFGIGISGNIELFTTMTESKEMASARVRFGESVAEVMSEIVKSTVKLPEGVERVK